MLNAHEVSMRNRMEENMLSANYSWGNSGPHFLDLKDLVLSADNLYNPELTIVQTLIDRAYGELDEGNLDLLKSLYAHDFKAKMVVGFSELDPNGDGKVLANNVWNARTYERSFQNLTDSLFSGISRGASDLIDFMSFSKLVVMERRGYNSGILESKKIKDKLFKLRLKSFKTQDMSSSFKGMQGIPSN